MKYNRIPFKVGDKVRIIDKESRFFNVIGRIIKSKIVTPPHYQVRINTYFVDIWFFHEDQLEGCKNLPYDTEGI